MKRVAIVNVGSFGNMTRNDYDVQAAQYGEYLRNQGVPVEITTVLPTSETAARWDVFVFLTRGAIADAKALKALYSEKVVVLLTGLPKAGDADGGIIPISKGDHRLIAGPLMDCIYGNQSKRLEAGAFRSVS